MATRYHMGCGQLKLDGYVNVDIVETPAADVVADLNDPQLPEPGEAFFSHAFFEHLRRDSRIPHLRAIRENATEDGFVCYLGLPDFQRVAELYLAGARGTIGPKFDLYNVYRYTHGDPEQNPESGWEPQLHKSLFDSDELGRLVRDAGWSSYVVFRYVFPNDPPELDLSLGFYATKQQTPVAELQTQARAFLQQYDGRFIQLSTIHFEDGASRSPLRTAVAGHPQQRLLKRARFALAALLARDSHPA